MIRACVIKIEEKSHVRIKPKKKKKSTSTNKFLSPRHTTHNMGSKINRPLLFTVDLRWRKSTLACFRSQTIHAPVDTRFNAVYRKGWREKRRSLYHRFSSFPSSRELLRVSGERAGPWKGARRVRVGPVGPSARRSPARTAACSGSRDRGCAQSRLAASWRGQPGPSPHRRTQARPANRRRLAPLRGDHACSRASSRRATSPPSRSWAPATGSTNLLFFFSATPRRARRCRGRRRRATRRRR